MWLTTQFRRHNHVLLAVPAVLWLTLFFILPLLLVFAVSFLTRGVGGTPTLPLTLEHYERAFTTFGGVLLRSAEIAGQTTLVCLLVGYPMAFYISTRQRAVVRGLLLFMVILPFWTNFLVRTYALRVLLGLEGPVNGLLTGLGLASAPVGFLNTEFAVVLGLVYGFLPFMVLPVYASVERLDFRLVEAARDLGSNDWQTFWRVVLPLTLPGVVAGSALVFIPAIGAFVTPDLLGGVKGLMIGNLIQRQYTGTGNLPLGAALSTVMLGAVMLTLMVYGWLAGRWSGSDGK